MTLNKLKTSLIALALVSFLTLATACSFKTAANVTVIALEGVVDAATGLIGTAAAVENPSADVTLALTYAKAASTAATESITEYNSSDATAVKIGVITGYWSQLAIPALGQTNASLIALGVSSVANAVSQFLAQLHPVAAHAIGARAGAIALAPVFTLHLADQAKLKAIQKKAEQNIDASTKLLAR